MGMIWELHLISNLGKRISNVWELISNLWKRISNAWELISNLLERIYYL